MLIDSWGKVRLFGAVVIGMLVQVFSLAGSPSGLIAAEDFPNSSSDQLVSFSVVPDGTFVGKKKSRLFSSIGSRVGGADKLMHIVEVACQRWSSPTNLNMTQVPDQGLPLGTRGLRYLDKRFGDIRIAAIPMPRDVRGVAFQRDSLVAGTWAGDIILNSNYRFDQGSLMAVLIHELGHSLGFEHVEGVDSVLSPSNKLEDLTRFDVFQLQQRFGVRSLDPYEADKPNDRRKEAVELRMHGSDEGMIPALAFGDISGIRDRDFFYLKPDEELVGDRMVIELRTQGNSLLKANLQVIDAEGNLLDSKSNVGGIATVVLPVDELGEQCYFRVASRDRQFAVGGYALVAYYESRNQIPDEELSEVAGWQNSHMRQNDLRERFLEGAQAYFFENDLHTNDTLGAADLLEPFALPTGGQMYRIDASISDAIDWDYYQFDISEDQAGHPLTLDIHSRDDGRLIPYASMYTGIGLSVPLQPLVNGNGQLLFQTGGLPVGTYVVAVGPGTQADQEYASGNYTLEMRFDRPLIAMPTLAEGNLEPGEDGFHTIRIARSQMFHLGLQCISELDLPNTAVFASIYNQQGQLLFRVATRPEEFRSAQSVLLSPGSYVLRVEYVQPNAEPNALWYRLSGIPDTESEGPTVIDPTASPFPNCDPDLNIYCYPEFRSSDPFIWVDGLSPDLGLPSDPPADWDNVDNWYWPDTAIA